MNNFIWNEIKSKKLKVIKKYKDELRDELANFGKSKGKYSSFGAFYELYLYAFAIGLHKNKRVKLEGHTTETFNMVSEWSRDKVYILNTFLMVLLSNKKIRQEAGFGILTLEMEDIDENEIKKKVNKLVTICEEYANGGLEFIYDRYKKEPENYEYHSSLQKLFEEVLEESQLNLM
jgi:hypothetical protein